MTDRHTDNSQPNNRRSPANARWGRQLFVVGKSLAITALAFILSLYIASPFSASLASLFSSADRQDFRMTDLFFQVADNRPVRQLEDRFVMVDVGNANRQEIADILHTIALCEPKIVAHDINFELPTDCDSLLLESLAMFPSVIIPVGLEARGDSFVISEKPFFYGTLPNATYAAVNFPSEAAGGTIREYATRFPMADGSMMPSFPLAVAEATDSDAIRPENYSNPTGLTAYHSKTLTIIPASDLYERAEELTGKAVLIGSTSESGDLYASPLRRGMSGMEIHAYALSTILNSQWLGSLATGLANLIAVVVCFLTVLTAISIKTGVRGLVIRIVQVVALYALVRVGYEMLVDHDTVADFSHAILMVAFGLFACDIWNGFDYLIRKSIVALRSVKHRNKPQLSK